MTIVVVGAGASGVHFALTALERGRKVVLVDVGRRGAPLPLPDTNISQLRTLHPDPVRYFLDDDYSGALIPSSEPSSDQDYYQLPRSKRYVFERPKQFLTQEDGLAPLISFAAGGLAECWTAGAYPFDDRDLEEFPFDHETLAPHYGKVAERIGVGGAADDLAAFIPVHENLSEPVRLGPASAQLLHSYESRKARLNGRHHVRLGRSRQATLSAARSDRAGCTYCGRCLWGCPNQALYTPSITLQQCLEHRNFTYLPDCYASHFELTTAHSISVLKAFSAEGAETTVAGDAYVLASGTLNSSAIFLRTLLFGRRERHRLAGLMDNRQVLAPFFNLSMLGRAHEPEAYQYHQLAVGLAGNASSHYVHGQITMLGAAEIHPLVQRLPFDLASSLKVLTATQAALGVLNLNFHDYRRESNFVTLDPDNGPPEAPSLKMVYRPRPDEDKDLNDALQQMRRFFLDIGAPLIPTMVKLRPMGASVHYAGTLPMSATPRPLTVSPEGRSYDFDNLYVVDGSVFPFLPAKNLTFTLMANATRIASGMV